MNREVEKQEIIRVIRSLALASQGVPPGQKKFQSATGIAPHVWQNRIWRRWSDALIDAGFEPLTWFEGYDDDAILTKVLNLAKRLQAFPKSGDLAFEGANNSDFVSNGVIKRRWKIAELAVALRDFAKSREEFEIVAYCNDFLASTENKRPLPISEVSDKTQHGFVYLIRYMKHYKIGRTSSVARRSRQVQVELPDETVLVHAILTDDPAGIEAYWHKRFGDKRGNGEWFRLTSEDVAAFRKWTKIV